MNDFFCFTGFNTQMDVGENNGFVKGLHSVFGTNLQRRGEARVKP